MTTSEAAKVLGVVPQLVRRLCKRGILRAKKHGRDWIIEKDSVMRYKASRRRGRPRQKQNRNGESNENMAM